MEVPRETEDAGRKVERRERGRGRAGDNGSGLNTEARRSRCLDGSGASAPGPPVFAVGSMSMPRKRPSKLDRYASRTAVAAPRHGTSADRETKRWKGPEPERGPCEVFNRGDAMNRAIASASRRGRDFGAS